MLLKHVKKPSSEKKLKRVQGVLKGGCLMENQQKLLLKCVFKSLLKVFGMDKGTSSENG